MSHIGGEIDGMTRSSIKPSSATVSSSHTGNSSSSSSSSGLYGLSSSVRNSTHTQGTNSNNSNIRLTAKSHAFAGAVLSPRHALELTPTLCLQITSALADHQKSVVPYTLWITDAWRVLGWAEPSAALFWEMATMYHALVAAGREMANHAGMIPPILSCGSTSSLGSGATNSHTTDNQRNPVEKKKLSSVASAKELPVWLVGTFLLLHCEEFAYLRNLAGQDERRFFGTGTASVASNATTMDFPGFVKNPSLSPRTRLHATWSNDNTHCTAFLLRHLRKILLLSAISHNHEATVACLHLAAMPTPTATPSSTGTLNDSSRANRLRSTTATSGKKYDSNDLRRQHADEHGNVGLQVRLTMEDLERLDFLFHPPSGGGIDDLPLRMGEFLWKSLYHDPPPPTASIPLAEVERELRQHLELELAVVAGLEDANDGTSSKLSSRGAGGQVDETLTTRALSQLSLSDQHRKRSNDNTHSIGSQVKVDVNAKGHKEVTYNCLRGTTVLYKPDPPESPSTASVTSGEPNFMNNVAMGRLHDVILSDCSDAHFYLLQPFEHATIASCTGCTIVLGAVAGLLYVVDCEKTTITCSSRRVLLSNSSDVQLNIFTPSPPLLVGDNRSCQFAPYNTFYDGMREDLLATGLAAAVVSEGQSPFNANRNESDAAWPVLQCASNKWKHPIEVAKLEVPQVPGSPGGLNVQAPLSPGADDRAMGSSGLDTTMQASLLVAPSEFQILFVPLESEAAKQRRFEAEEGDCGAVVENVDASVVPMESQYCRLLAEVLQLSPFHLPLEYERRALMKAERMKTIQQAVQKRLAVEQQRRFEEELNRGFRDWLVSSGNLRQVLDLVHLEVKGS